MIGRSNAGNLPGATSEDFEGALVDLGDLGEEWIGLKVAPRTENEEPDVAIAEEIEPLSIGRPGEVSGCAEGDDGFGHKLGLLAFDMMDPETQVFVGVRDPSSVG